jgi:putative transposase
MGEQKRYSYSAHLTGGQRRDAARLFGCCRWVYNAFLAERERLYREGRHRQVDWGDTARTVTTVAKRRQDTAWLAEVSAVPLQQATADARRAYSNWYGSMSGKRKGPRVGKPRFKKRTARQSARFTANARFAVRAEPGCKWAWVTLPGIGPVKFALSRPLPSMPSSVTLIKDADGTFRVSFVVAVPADPEVEPAHPGRVASIDVGVGDDLAVVTYSDGTREKIDNPRHLRTRARKVRRENKALARKQKGSKNWNKQQAKLAKVHRQAADARRDHHRKLARRLTVENAVVCRETLSLRGMGRTRLARSVYDAGIGTLFELLDEEAENQGRTVATAGRWEPTTQTCSVCGTPGGKKPLSVRTWTCGGCGTVLDRDYNAAVNVMVAAGLAETRNACGGDVRRTLACADPETTRRGEEAGTHRTDHTKRVAA